VIISIGCEIEHLKTCAAIYRVIKPGHAASRVDRRAVGNRFFHIERRVAKPSAVIVCSSTR
jgi:hypothetical protein